MRGAREAIRLLIVDDDDLFAELVRELVAADERIEVVGRARNGHEAIEAARTLAPDVIVMDIEMPVLDGITATRRIGEEDPRIRVVVFTGSDEARDEQRAREAGAVAFVRKSHIDAVLLAAIERAGRRDDLGTDVARAAWRCLTSSAALRYGAA